MAPPLPSLPARARQHRVAAAVAALAMVAGPTPLAAYAGGPGAAPSERVGRQGEVLDFAIPAGPLEDAVRQVARAAGINLAYDAALLDGLRGQALQGRYTVPGALAVLLAGSGVEAVAQPGGGFLLRRDERTPQVLPRVTVRAGLPGETSPPVAGGHLAPEARLGLLGETAVADAPFNVVAFTRQAIDDLQARTVGDVLANDASVRYVSQPGGILDAFSVRGFPVGNGNYGEIAFNGVYGVASNYRVSTAYVERVELIKGPTAMLAGMAPSGGIGGGINIVPKRPGAEDFTVLTAEYASSSQPGGQVDVSRRVGEDRRLGIRFNGALRDGDTGLDNQSRTAGSAALALDYQGSRGRATVDLIDQRETLIAPSRLPHLAAGIGVPAAPDGRRNMTQPWEYSRIRDQSVLLHTEYDVSDDVTWFADAGGGRTRVSRLFSIAPTIIDEAGNASLTHSNYRFDVERASVGTGLRARFATGPVTHALNVVASGYRDQLGRGTETSPVSLISNLYRPVALPRQAVPAPGSVPTISESRLTSVAVADTAGMFDQRLQVTLGVRHQRIESDNFRQDGGFASRYDRGALTPLLGVVVKPWNGVSFYANRVQGLSKGDIAPDGASNAGEIFAPYRSTQYEVGARLERGSTLATVSVFQIRRPGGRTVGSVFVTDAEQRHRGMELSLYGEPWRGARVMASTMLLDAQVTRGGAVGLDGARPAGTPALLANVGGEWDLPSVPGMTLTAAAIYTGRQYVDAANTQSIPAWTRMDLGLRYRTTALGAATTVRLLVRNVLDRHYWAAVDSFGGLAQGEPRTVLLSATYRF
jgi:iron complex outermembrane receptor protein